MTETEKLNAAKGEIIGKLSSMGITVEAAAKAHIIPVVTEVNAYKVVVIGKEIGIYDMLKHNFRNSEKVKLPSEATKRK